MRIVILFLNGAFGIGKTTVSRALAKRLPRAVVFDPEPLGILLQRIRRVDDFQDLRAWRRLTIVGIRLAHIFAKHVIVPMAFSNPAYLREIRDGVGESKHVCLVASEEVVLARLRARGVDAGEWVMRRALECCAAHRELAPAETIPAGGAPAEIVEELLLRLRAAP
ncbi:MAG TPA: AAA family ATPase [Thermoanaerobaculia bacterium]|nr:AAA family ATPase [Thermoanaerobaculia bacterium]